MSNVSLIRVPVFLVESKNTLSFVEAWDGSLSLETNDPYIASHGHIRVGFVGDKFIFGAYPEEWIPWIAPWHLVMLRRHLE